VGVVEMLPGSANPEGAVANLGIEVDGALELAEQTDV